MAIQTSTLERDGYTYKVTQLDGLKGRRTFMKLMNLLGPAFRMAADPAQAVGNLLTNLKDADLDFFCELFGEYTTVTGGEYEDKTPLLKGKVFMDHFAGRYGAMFEWLVFSILANFSSFFSEIEGLLEKYGPKEVPAPKE